MAEIKVERKSGTPWWVYLIGLLVVLALVVFGVRGCDTPTTGDQRREPASLSNGGNGAAGQTAPATPGRTP